MGDSILDLTQCIVNNPPKRKNHETKKDKTETGKNYALFFADYFHCYFVQ